MADNPEDAAAPQAEPAADAPAGPPAPFWVRGSDGSERGPYPELDQAQASKENVVKVHETDGVQFVVTDATGAVIG